MKISKDEANVIAGKVNALVQKSYRDEKSFILEDVINCGVTIGQAKKIMDDLVKSRILYTKDDKFSAHPMVLAEIKEGNKDATI